MNGLRFVESITDFFKSPKWLINVLLGGVCILIPVVGPLVLLGWHATIFHGRGNRGGGEVAYWQLPPAAWPEFDFGRFVVYLQRGLWPFLVALVAGLAAAPIMVLCAVPVMAALATTRDHEPNEVVMLMAGVLSGGMALVMGTLLNVLLAPFVLRAYALQDFKAAFSLGWVQDYLKRMWKEQLVVMLFSTATGLVFALGGYVMLCVGVYFTIGIAMFSGAHLQRQLLDLYVQRGGEPLTPAASLLDQPATTPAVWPSSPPPPPPMPPT